MVGKVFEYAQERFLKELLTVLNYEKKVEKEIITETGKTENFGELIFSNLKSFEKILLGNDFCSESRTTLKNSEAPSNALSLLKWKIWLGSHEKFNKVPKKHKSVGALWFSFYFRKLRKISSARIEVAYSGLTGSSPGREVFKASGNYLIAFHQHPAHNRSQSPGTFSDLIGNSRANSCSWKRMFQKDVFHFKLSIFSFLTNCGRAQRTQLVCQWDPEGINNTAL